MAGEVLVSSGVRRGVGLVAALRECGGADDCDNVRGVLGALFTSLPVVLQARKLEDVLYAQDMCFVAVLEETTEQELRSVGLSVGAARLVLNLIFEEVVDVEPVVVEAAPPEEGEHAVSRGPRGVLRSFPELGRTGFPGVRGWRAFVPALKAFVAAAAGEAALVGMERVMKDPSCELVEGWQRGGAADRVIPQAMVNQGAGSMPDDLLLALVEADVADQAGLSIFRFITRRVMTVCDESVGERLAQFTAVVPVAEGAKCELALRLQEWKALRGWLEKNDCKQSRVQCALSLRRLVGRVPEVARAMEALDARFVGAPTPLSECITLVECLAEKYSAMGTGNSSAAWVVVQADGEGGAPRDRVCRYWKSGRCFRGSKCSFKHVGKPDYPAPKPAGAKGVGEQVEEAMNAWFVSRVNGVRAERGVSAAEAELWVLQVLGLLKVGSKGEDPKRSAPNPEADNNSPFNNDCNTNEDPLSSSRSAGRPQPIRPQPIRPQPIRSEMPGAVCTAEGLSPPQPPPTTVCGCPAARAVMGATLGGVVSVESTGYQSRVRALLLQELQNLGVYSILNTNETGEYTECNKSNDEEYECSNNYYAVLSGLSDIEEDKDNNSGQNALVASANMNEKGVECDKCGVKCHVNNMVYTVVGDSGATVRVIGGKDAGKAVNISKLSEPVAVETADGKVWVDSVGDLPGYGGLMTKCLIMVQCAHSLMPIVPICKELDLSYSIDRGGTGARFHKDGETVLEMIPSGGVMVAPESGTSL